MSGEAGGGDGGEEFGGMVAIVRAHSYYKKSLIGKYWLGLRKSMQTGPPLPCFHSFPFLSIPFHSISNFTYAVKMDECFCSIRLAPSQKRLLLTTIVVRERQKILIAQRAC